MSSSLPDDFFRPAAGSDGAAEEPDDHPATPWRRRGFNPAGGVSLARLGTLALVALLGGWLLSSLLLRVTHPSPAASPSAAEASASESPGSHAPYEGEVIPTAPLAADSECTNPDGEEDLARRTTWRCSGDGKEQSVTFTVPAGEQIVGIRAINGNAQMGRYSAERRIISVRWDFSDGSFVEQGFAMTAQPQEIRFPPVASEGKVVMTVRDSTEPGEKGPDCDAVSISELQFLRPA